MPENLSKLGLCGLKVHEGLREFTDECGLDGTLGENGWYTSTVAVTLTASDATSGVIAVAYRSSGGAQQEHTNPFTVDDDGTHTVEYFSTDVAGNTESVKPRLQDRHDPTLPFHFLPASGACLTMGDIEMTWSASDATSGIDHFEVVLDEGTPVVLPATATSTPSPAWVDGAHTVTITALRCGREIGRPLRRSYGGYKHPKPYVAMATVPFSARPLG